MPKVSVIMPTYNRARFIAESIQSVLAQTFTDFEIIVVDDGSRDNTREVVNSFRDSRITYIYQKNRGVSVARNTGIKAANGEYFIFLDSDDVLLKGAIEKRVKVMDRHPEVGFSYGQTYLMDARGRVFGLWKLRRGNSGIRRGTEELRDFLMGNHVPTLTVMVRGSCLFAVGLFDLTFSAGSEDLELWIRLAKKYSAAYLAEPLAKYRIHQSSITVERKMDEEVKTKSRILESILDDPELGHLYTPLRSKAYFHLHLRLARHAYDVGDTVTAREHLFLALKIQPRGLVKGIWLYWFAKTWLPLPVINVLRGVKKYLGMASWHVLRRSYWKVRASNA